MIYALNLFNIRPGREQDYMGYSKKASKHIVKLGGKLVFSGYRPVRMMRGDVERGYIAIIEFPDEQVFDSFHDKAAEEGLHTVREAATSDYIWMLFQSWDLPAWFKEINGLKYSAS